MGLSLVNAQSNSGSGTAITVTKPTGLASGDRLIVIVNHNNETLTVSDNNGATPTTKENGEMGGGVGTGAFTVFYRNAGGSEPASYAFTMSGSDRWAVVGFGLRGQAASIWDVTPAFGQQESSSAPTCPACVTIASGAWAFACAGIDNAAGGTFNAAPAGWTLVATQNGQQPISIYSLEMLTPGSTGAQDFGATAVVTNYTLTCFSVAPLMPGRGMLLAGRRNRRVLVA